MKCYHLLLFLAALVHVIRAEQIDPPVPCKNTTDCTNIPRLPASTFCKDGYCVCPGANGAVKNCSSVVAVLGNNNKTITPLVSRTCKHDQECMLKNGFCNTTISQCDCLKGFVPSANKQQCLKTAESIGSNCTDDRQCLAFQANTTCKDERCVCGTGYHNVDNACWRMAGFGKPCTKTQECSHILNAICNDKKACGCAEGKVISENETKCLSVAQKFQDSCAESVQCSTKFTDSVCRKEKCQCRARYHFVEQLQKCIVNKALDEECENTYECYQPENENDTARSKALQCLANVCGYVDSHSKEGDKCINGGNGSRLFDTSVSIVLLAILALVLSSW